MMATSKQLIVPSGLHIYGPAIADNLSVRFDFDCAKNGIFQIIPSPQMTAQIAAELNKEVFYAVSMSQPFKSYYDQTGPVDGTAYKYRDYTIEPNGNYNS